MHDRSERHVWTTGTGSGSDPTMPAAIPAATRTAMLEDLQFDPDIAEEIYETIRRSLLCDEVA